MTTVPTTNRLEKSSRNACFAWHGGLQGRGVGGTDCGLKLEERKEALGGEGSSRPAMEGGAGVS